ERAHQQASAELRPLSDRLKPRRRQGVGRLPTVSVRRIPARDRRARPRTRPATAARRPAGHDAAPPRRREARDADPRTPRAPARPVAGQPPATEATHEEEPMTMVKITPTDNG